MKFRDLLEQPYDELTGIIHADPLRKRLQETPFEVVEQVYSQHGRKNEFQEQYGDLELSSITWVSTALPATKIIQATCYPGFIPWLSNVESRSLAFSKGGWRCIDMRDDVIAHWSAHRTWLRPPVFIQGIPPAIGDKLHLMEGHTRVGLLRGLVNIGLLSPSSQHEILVGM